MMDSLGLVLPGNPVSKGNSAAYQTYKRNCQEHMNRLVLPHYEGMVRITAYYYLKSWKNWADLASLMQTTADILCDDYKVINRKRTLVKQGILANTAQIVSWDGTLLAGVDKDNPRVSLWICPVD